MNACFLCPRSCGVDRAKNKGFCGADEKVMIAKVMLHKWEEPCVCYGKGSGAVFFSSCQLKCVFCQNREISRSQCGTPVNEETLCKLFLNLQEKGACNINLVSPTPHLNTVIPAIVSAKKKGLDIPVMMNSGGYESVETLKRLEGLIDIYMPDFKFFDPQLSHRYAQAENYADVATAALTEMRKQMPFAVWDEGHLIKGILVRHLILPGQSKDSLAVLKRLSEIFPEGNLVLSVLRQFTPIPELKLLPELNRKITSLEYEKVLREAKKLSFSQIYSQKKESASAEYIPDFNKGIDNFLS